MCCKVVERWRGGGSQQTEHVITLMTTSATAAAMNTCHSYLKNVPHYLPSSLKVMLLYFPASLGRAVHYLISGVMEKATSDRRAAWRRQQEDEL